MLKINLFAKEVTTTNTKGKKTTFTTYSTKMLLPLALKGSLSNVKVTRWVPVKFTMNVNTSAYTKGGEIEVEEDNVDLPLTYELNVHRLNGKWETVQAVKDTDGNYKLPKQEDLSDCDIVRYPTVWIKDVKSFTPRAKATKRNYYSQSLFITDRDVMNDVPNEDDLPF